MKTCPNCSRQTTKDAESCSRCGATLAGEEGPPCSEDAAQLLGRVLNGKYKVLSVLGEGGMGVVYKVRHLILQRRNLFALKILHPTLSNDEHFRTRFLREVEVAMELTHENIIQIRDFGLTEDSRLFFTMDYFEGQSLRSLIRAEGRIPQQRAVGILRQLLKAMCEAYRQGVVHRDLKPDNVLVERLDYEDEVKVLDFGIAKILDVAEGADQNMTRGGIVGSPRYMSPEQVAGDRVDHRSDLYSLGVIFFEMLTGTPPFRAKTAQAVLSQQLSANVPRLEEACPGIHVAPHLEKLMRSLMAKEPNKRPATPHDVLDVLDGASTLVMTPYSSRRGTGLVKNVALAVIGVVAFGLAWTLDPDWADRLSWASEWGSEATGSETPAGGDTPSGSPSGADGGTRHAAVRFRCQICGRTFADGELSGNTHHDLPMERVAE